MGRFRVKWLSVYDQLWLKFKLDKIRFDDVLKLVYPDKKEFEEKEVKYISKLLSEMEHNSYVIRFRSEFDQRVNIYKLIPPEKATVVWGFYSKCAKKERGMSFTILLKEAHKEFGWNYMHIKDSAVYYHTSAYRSIEVQHVSVSKKDSAGWIALFNLFNYRILVNNKLINESRESGETINLHTNLDEKGEQLKSMTNTHVQPRVYTVTECLKDGDILGALAILIRLSWTDNEWDKLIKLAADEHVINILGFCMDYVNKKADRIIFKKELMEKVHNSLEKKIEIIGEEPEFFEESRGEKELEKKWKTRCYNMTALRKAVQDLL